MVSKPAANSHWLSGLGLGGYAGWDPLDHTGSGGGGGGVGGWTDTGSYKYTLPPFLHCNPMLWGFMGGEGQGGNNHI